MGEYLLFLIEAKLGSLLNESIYLFGCMSFLIITQYKSFHLCKIKINLNIFMNSLKDYILVEKIHLSVLCHYIYRVNCSLLNSAGNNLGFRCTYSVK